MKIGEWIKKQRTQWGYSQSFMGELLEVNRSAVAQWESGATTPHRLRMSEIDRLIGPIPEKIVKATWG